MRILPAFPGAGGGISDDGILVCGTHSQRTGSADEHLCQRYQDLSP